MARDYVQEAFHGEPFLAMHVRPSADDCIDVREERRNGVEEGGMESSGGVIIAGRTQSVVTAAIMRFQPDAAPTTVPSIKPDTERGSDLMTVCVGLMRRRSVRAAPPAAPGTSTASISAGNE